MSFKGEIDVPKRTTRSVLNLRRDKYCWKCHKDGSDIPCSACIRSWHKKCVGTPVEDVTNWICGECAARLKAENPETCSQVMSGVKIDLLCTLLNNVVMRMRSNPGSEPFLNAVDTSEVDNYLEYIVHPMDLSLLEANVANKMYGSTEAFMADAKWIQHNCIVYNTCGRKYEDHSKLTNAAKQMIKVGRQEVLEIEACPECYARGRNLPRPIPNWFIEPCRIPHVLVWAKLKGFPFWPAKAMPRLNTSGFVDVRFFGQHDRAWVTPKDIYLYSTEPPTTLPRKRKHDLDVCLDEINIHCEKLSHTFGRFQLADFKVPYDPYDSEQIKLLLPDYNPSDVNLEKELGPALPKERARSVSRARSRSRARSVSRTRAKSRARSQSRAASRCRKRIDYSENAEQCTRELRPRTPKPSLNFGEKLESKILQDLTPGSDALSSSVAVNEENLRADKPHSREITDTPLSGWDERFNDEHFNFNLNEKERKSNGVLKRKSIPNANTKKHSEILPGGSKKRKSDNKDKSESEKTRRLDNSLQRDETMIKHGKSSRSSPGTSAEANKTSNSTRTPLKNLPHLKQKPEGASVNRTQSKARKSYPNKMPVFPQETPETSLPDATLSPNAMVYIPSVNSHDASPKPTKVAHTVESEWNNGLKDISLRVEKLIEDVLIKRMYSEENATIDESAKAALAKMQLSTMRLKLEHEQQLSEHLQENIRRQKEIEKQYQLSLEEMKAALKQEHHREMADAEKEKQRIVKEIKLRRWCVACLAEATYACCLNATYCGTACQQNHWSTHKDKCTHVALNNIDPNNVSSIKQMPELIKTTSKISV